jgi:micrococcal nuclease
MKFWIQLFVVVFIAANAFAQIQGKVIGITDGNTFTLLTEDKQRIKVQVYGIDCPETMQDYGRVARNFASDLIFGKQVYIEDKGKDMYDRQLGIVYSLPDSTCLNIELLKAGLAWHYKNFDKNEKWAELEQQARDSKTGLWERTDAVAPWEWRKMNKS